MIHRIERGAVPWPYYLGFKLVIIDCDLLFIHLLNYSKQSLVRQGLDGVLRHVPQI